MSIDTIFIYFQNILRMSFDNRSFKKKVYRDLDHVETCGFLHGVQHVPNNTFEVFSDIANF